MQCALILAQQGSSTAVDLIFFVTQLAIIILIVAGFWKVFTKAGYAGWLAIIPIVNIWFLAKVGGLPGWVGLLMLIPLVNLIVAIFISYKVAQAFGHGVLMAVGLFFLGFIFYPVLGFGSSEYQGPVA